MGNFSFDPTGGLGMTSDEEQSFLEELQKVKDELDREERELSDEDKAILKANKDAVEFVIEELGTERFYGFVLSAILGEVMRSHIVLLQSLVEDDDVPTRVRVQAVSVIESMERHTDMVGQISMALWGTDLMDKMREATIKFYEQQQAEE